MRKHRREFLGLVVWTVLLVGLVTNFFTGRLNARQETAYDNIQLFHEAYSLIFQEYYKDLAPKQKELIYNALQGMVKFSLDPHSSFVVPEAYKELEVETEGHFGGLGILMQKTTDGLIIYATLDTSPARAAGIKPGDLIVAIEGEPTKDMESNAAVSKLRGKEGTKVTVTVRRRNLDTGESSDFDVTVGRAFINNSSIVDVNFFDESKVGYVRVSDFKETTATELKDAILGLKKKGMEGFILDLRYNSGGVLDGAVDVSDLFLQSNKLIVYIEGRDSQRDGKYFSKRADILEGKPMVVLINGSSASASEIVAGCMQYWKRATLVGEKTYGKGSVQAVIPLKNDPDGSAIRLTTALYYLGSGETIDGVGVKPDVEVTVPEEELPVIDRQLYIREVFHKNGLDNNLEEQKRLVQLLDLEETFPIKLSQIRKKIQEVEMDYVNRKIDGKEVWKQVDEIKKMAAELEKQKNGNPRDRQLDKALEVIKTSQSKDSELIKAAA